MTSPALGYLEHFLLPVKEVIQHAPLLSVVGSFITGGGAAKFGALVIERRDKGRERARLDLADLYSPIQLHFQSGKSLESYLASHRNTLKSQLTRFDTAIEVLLREALSGYAAPLISFGGPSAADIEQTERLAGIEKKLRPLLDARERTLRERIAKRW